MPFNPAAIINKSTDENTKNCKDTPNECLWQCIVDAMVFVTMFTSMSFLIDHRGPNINNILTFVSVWIPTLFLLKAMDLEYSDQLARVIGWSLGSKMFSSLVG